MHVGHILIGLVGLPCMIMPSKISATWFPPHQRSFAIALITNASMGLGAGLGFLMSPYLTKQFGIRTMLEVQTEIAVFIALLTTIRTANSSMFHGIGGALQILGIPEAITAEQELLVACSQRRNNDGGSEVL